MKLTTRVETPATAWRDRARAVLTCGAGKGDRGEAMVEAWDDGSYVIVAADGYRLGVMTVGKPPAGEPIIRAWVNGNGMKWAAGSIKGSGGFSIRLEIDSENNQISVHQPAMYPWTLDAEVIRVQYDRERRSAYPWRQLLSQDWKSTVDVEPSHFARALAPVESLSRTQAVWMEVAEGALAVKTTPENEAGEPIGERPFIYYSAEIDAYLSGRPFVSGINAAQVGEILRRLPPSTQYFSLMASKPHEAVWYKSGALDFLVMPVFLPKHMRR